VTDFQQFISARLEAGEWMGWLDGWTKEWTNGYGWTDE
jgi:hypothetical protein